MLRFASLLARTPAALALILALLVGSCDMRRGGAEPPPAEIQRLGKHPDYREVELDELEVDRVCRAANVDANDEWNRKWIRECVIPAQKLIVLRKNATREDRLHAYGHSQGFVHREDGTGWVKAPNVFAQSPVQYDWRNVFAPRPSETAATQPGNPFRGR